MEKSILYYGDNLKVLRENVKHESVDLIYLDPPFNSQANYNVLFRAPTGEQSHAQIEAFEDTWHWGDSAEHAFDEVMKSGNTDAAELLRAMRSFLKENDMMAYLTMLAVRLLELHRVLKPTGSLYLHCDPTAAHYLKILLDGIFGLPQFRNEIIWKRSSAHSDTKQGAKHYGRLTDTIFFYSKGEDVTWNQLYRPYDDVHRARLSARRARRTALSARQHPRSGRSGERQPLLRRHGCFPPLALFPRKDAATYRAGPHHSDTPRRCATVTIPRRNARRFHTESLGRHFGYQQPLKGTTRLSDAEASFSVGANNQFLFKRG
jgi:hypothetical protein